MTLSFASAGVLDFTVVPASLEELSRATLRDYTSEA